MSQSSELSWVDPQGKVWSLRIKLGDVSRLKEAGTDLFDAKFLESLFGFPLQLIETAAELLRPAWQTVMTYEDFADLVTADPVSYQSFASAFRRALQDFFRRLGQVALAELTQKAAEAAERIGSMMVEKVKSDKLTRLMATAEETAAVEFDRQIDAEIARIAKRSGIMSG